MVNSMTLKFRVEQGELGKDDLSLVYTKYCPLLRTMGKRLALLNIIPLIEDPMGSKKYRTSSNMSIRVREVNVNGYLITGSNVIKSDLRLEDCLFVTHYDRINKVFTAYGDVQPSREIFISQELYERFTQLSTVIHIHDLLALQHYRKLQLPITRRKIFFADEDEAKEIADLIDKIPACITLKDHGQIFCAHSVNEALEYIEKINQMAVAIHREQNLTLPH